MKSLEDRNYTKIAQYCEDMQNQFRMAQNSLQMDIEHWYQRLADNNEISYAAAKRLLKAGELEEFHWAVEEYIKHGKENALNQQWMKQLENASARVHINYLQAMKLQLGQHAELLYQKYHNGVTDFLTNIYSDNFYHTAYEIAKGSGVAGNLAELDTRRINLVLTTPWAQDGRNFSDRIWQNKDKLVRELHMELAQCIIRGENPDKAAARLADSMDVKVRQARTLIYTESAAIAMTAQRDCFQELDVEEYEVVETLDSITCSFCQDMDGKHFPLSDYQVGITAPPFHPNCRGCTCPYFKDEFTAAEKRSARNKEGEIYYVPSDMNYKEWKQSFVKNKPKEMLTATSNGSTIKAENINPQSESQRYGRNKGTLVNSTYINSGEYRKKFDKITENKTVNRVLYAKAKEMLKHRSGTKLEDTYWIDSSTGDIAAYVLDSQMEGKIVYTIAIENMIKRRNDLITMHTHPDSMPPSISDFNSAFRHGYAVSLVLCHNGKVFQYVAKEEIRSSLYDIYIKSFLLEGYTEYEAQLNALYKLKENYDIDFWEVII